MQLTSPLRDSTNLGRPSRLGLVRTFPPAASAISTFGRLAIREGGFEEATGQLLRSLFERRNQADYAPVDIPAPEGEAAIRDAERFVGSVSAWPEPRRG